MTNTTLPAGISTVNFGYTGLVIIGHNATRGMVPGGFCMSGTTLNAAGQDGNCELSLRCVVEGEHFVMLGGKSGAHSLAISATSAERLLAHWRGYLENNGYNPARPTLSGNGYPAR